MKYMIVKRAGQEWALYFDKDPKLSQQPVSMSAYGSYTGECLPVQKFYTDKLIADWDCKKMNEINPCGYYGVCEMEE